MNRQELNALHTRWRQDLRFEEPVLGKTMQFTSTWGLFSPEKLDDGSLMLLDHIEFRKADSSIDLGCGYGVATHWLATFTDGRTFLGVDYDEEKIRTAKRTAPDHPRIQFETGDILEREFPACDAILLLDVLHYWTPDKQQLILNKARQALRPGGRLILRDGARAENEAHRRVHFWERVATRIGHNQTKEGLHFLTLLFP